MGFLNSIDISASGLTAQHLRMDTIASNLANAESTRVQNGNGPYRRQVVLLEAKSAVNGTKFAALLKKQGQSNNIMEQAGVRVKEIRSLDEDQAPFRRVYDPEHPDADQDGYVNYPNVNVVEEMVNLIAASKSYEANAKVIEASRSMAMSALGIGR
ncbi:MAG: flagellar basal body rod protein FlgC [Syntrophomonadaceae bacterium]|jgi:flagellar basal-body rod protein FlgC|nr:flagellar basal body rod protein FlgC [Syntrophomonadaceae bacterium]